MIEFLQELVSSVNLPITVLLGLTLCYWMLVILGVLGAEAIDFDFGLDADIDVGMDADADGLFGDALHFMHMGDTPVMIIGTVFVFFLWICTVVSNHYLNSDCSYWLSAIYLVPNLIVSLLLTKLVIMPLVAMSKHDYKAEFKREEMIGMAGVVKTTEVNETFGQIEIFSDGPPIVVNARTSGGPHLSKGDRAKIVSYDSNKQTFTVELSKWEKE